jgi:hypothetical protein
MSIGTARRDYATLFDALRDAIRKLWEDPQLAHQMGLAGRRHLEEYFDPTIVRRGIKSAILSAWAEDSASD